MLWHSSIDTPAKYEYSAVNCIQAKKTKRFVTTSMLLEFVSKHHILGGAVHTVLE